MEIQSGNGEEVVSAVSATSGLVSRGPSGWQVEASGEPVRGEDLQATKRIERFDIPLDTLKRMFEKPPGANTVSTAAVHFLVLSGCEMCFSHAMRFHFSPGELL